MVINGIFRNMVKKIMKTVDQVIFLRASSNFTILRTNIGARLLRTTTVSK